MYTKINYVQRLFVYNSISNMQQTKVYSLNFLTPLPVSQCFRKENKQTNKKKQSNKKDLTLTPLYPTLKFA